MAAFPFGKQDFDMERGREGSAVSNGVLDASPYLSLFDREPAGDRVSLRPDYDYHAFDLEAHDEQRKAMEKMAEKARKVADG